MNYNSAPLPPKSKKTPLGFSNGSVSEPVKGKMKRSRSEKTIRSLIKDRKRMRFDLAIQRNNVWTSLQKSMLIHSVLDNYPIPVLYVQQSHDDQHWMLDGKQRLTSIFEFYDDQLALLKGTPPVMIENEDGEIEYVNIEGKRFSQLDKELQEEFLSYDLSIIEIRNITTEQVEELFQRLNAGSPLTKIELTRAKAGRNTMDFVSRADETVLFGTYSSISDGARNRFVDHELILQTLLLMMGRETGISTREVEEFVVALKATGIPEDVEEKFFAITSYMEQAFGQFDDKLRNKMLKKTHIPMLFIRAIDAIEEEVSTKAFGLWAKSFFMDRYKGSVYASNCSSAVARKNKVDARLSSLESDYRAHIEEAIELSNKGTEDAEEIIHDPNQYDFDDQGNIRDGDGNVISD